MKQLEVYLVFPGNCEEALGFYEHCLGGQIVSMKRFGESPVNAAKSDMQRIMHAEFRADDIYFMASDNMPDQKVHTGTNVSLSINLDDKVEQEQIFGRLSEGGTVGMSLQETYWGAMFGMVTDKYGIHWLLNREIPK